MSDVNVGRSGGQESGRLPSNAVVGDLQRLLGVAAVWILFTNLPRYLLDSGIVGIPPAIALVSFMVAALGLLAANAPTRLAARSPLIWWGMFSLLIVLVGYLIGSRGVGALGETLRSGLTVVSAWAFLLIFCDAHAAASGRRAVMWATLLAVALNLVDVLRPMTFSHFAGRAAGLYLNPNIAASAIVYGMLVGTGTLAPRTRPWFVIATGIGVLSTFSRGGMVVWAIAVALYVLAGTVRPRLRQVVFAVCATGAIVATLPAGTLSVGVALLGAVEGNQAERLGVGGLAAAFGGTSGTERREVARHAWNLFLEHPILGSGPGATTSWSESQSTHNMYLKFMAEYGFLGLFIYPCVVIAAFWRAPRPEWPLAITFSLAWVLFGLISHNEFGHFHLIVAIGLVSASTVVARSDEGPEDDALSPMGEPA